MILILHLIIFAGLLSCFCIKYNKHRLNFVITSLVAGIITATTAIGVVAAHVIGAVVAVAVYGGIALLSSALLKKSGLANSPTYQSMLQTQTNPDLPVPLLYGTVKLAGNRIWQNEPSEDNIKRIVAFAEGEITEFTDIRLNDIPADKVSGCTVEKFYGTSLQGLPSMVTLDKVGSLRNVAYLAIKCNKTSKIDINYNLTAVVKGRKIKVYTNTSTYEVKYSENPAWVLFDFLTSYNGLGMALDNDCAFDNDLANELFDINSFIEAAAYCDELVSYTDNEGNVKASPRFTFNMIFDSQASARDLLDEIYRSCRGGLFTYNGKLQFKIDKAEAVSQVFTVNDIIKGSETFSVIPAEEKYEILRVSYVSPDHEWQKVEAFAEVPVYRYGAPVEHNINLYSCTNFPQAARLAWYYVNAKRLCPYFGSFQTDYRAYTLEVGDVIEINSLLMGLSNYKVKVNSVENDGSGIFTVQWRNYDPNLYTDTLGCKEPTALVTNIGEIYTFPKDVENFNVVQSNDLYVFSWSLNNETDTYEIRYGDTNATWDTAETIQKGTLLDTFSYKIKQTGVKKFFIKAFNELNYSENATVDVLSVEDIPETNILVTYDILNPANGTHTNTKLYNGKLKLTVNNVLWETTTDKWGEGDTYYKQGDYWGASTYTTGNYVSQVYDVGGVLLSTINYSSSWFCSDETASVEIYWRHSNDNETWTDWEILLIGPYTFRYSQYKVVINSPNGIEAVFTDLTIIVDVPDKFETREVSVTDALEGVRVELVDYHAIPSIVATVNDNITAYAVVTEKDIDYAVIKIYDNSGDLTAGDISLYIKGF